MLKNKLSLFFSLALLAVAGGCEKEQYSFGDIKTPSALSISTTVAGANATNPDGDGSGGVTIAATASNAINYKIDFGDGITKMVPEGSTSYKYTTPGTQEYTITVNAIGTGGSLSTISKKVKVFVAFEIPDYIVEDLTGGTSKVWVTDKEAGGHFGVGPNNAFEPIWYAAGPNSREACAYDDEITFTKDGNGISMTLDNKGQSFSIGAASGFYGFSGGDGCYAVTAAAKKLSFSDATSGSTSANSTQIQFMVPGSGIVNFGTGGVVYEILSITENSVSLRNIGIDGNSWYQKLKVK